MLNFQKNFLGRSKFGHFLWMGAIAAILGLVSCNSTGEEPERRIFVDIKDSGSEFSQGDSLRVELLRDGIRKGPKAGDTSIFLFNGLSADSAGWRKVQLPSGYDPRKKQVDVKVSIRFQGRWRPIRLYSFYPDKAPAKEIYALDEKPGPNTGGGAGLDSAKLTLLPATNGRVEASGGLKSRYPKNQPIILTAVADSGYVFVGWKGDTSSSQNVLILKLNRDMSLFADFQKEGSKRKHPLSLLTDGQGKIAITLLEAFHEEPVDLPPAAPHSGFTFDRWTVDSGAAKVIDSSSSTSAKAVLTGPARIKAHFKAETSSAPAISAVEVAGPTSVRVGFALVERAASYVLYYKLGTGPFKSADSGVVRIANYAPNAPVSGLIHHATYVFSLAAVGPAGESALSPAKVQVVNRKPAMEAPGNQAAAENKVLTFTLKASDPDGDPTSISLTGAPTGSQFNAASGVFTWIPGFNESSQSQNRKYTLTAKAADGKEDSAQTLTLTVENVNRPPEITIGGMGKLDTTVEIGRVYEQNLEAVDLDGENLSVTYKKRPEGLVLDLANKKIRWSADREKFSPDSQYSIDIAVSDGIAKDSLKWTIKVTSRQWTEGSFLSTPNWQPESFAAKDSISIYSVGGPINAREIVKCDDFRVCLFNRVPYTMRRTITHIYATDKDFYFGGNDYTLGAFVLSGDGAFGDSKENSVLYKLKAGNSGKPFFQFNYYVRIDTSGHWESKFKFMDQPSPESTIVRIDEKKGFIKDLESFSNGVKMFLQDNLYYLEKGKPIAASPRRGEKIATDFSTRTSVFLMDSLNRLFISPTSRPISFDNPIQLPGGLRSLCMLTPRLGWLLTQEGDLFFTNDGWSSGFHPEKGFAPKSISQIFLSGDGKTLFAIDENKKIFRY